MTATRVKAEIVAPEIHLRFKEVPSTTLLDLVRQLASIDTVWEVCYGIEDLLYGSWSPKQQQLPDLRLVVKRLTIQSPTLIELAVPGATTAAGAYALHLFVQVVRTPDSLGAWLPKLVESWHNRWIRAEAARIGYFEARAARLSVLNIQLQVAVSDMRPPEHVTAIALPPTEPPRGAMTEAAKEK